MPGLTSRRVASSLVRHLRLQRQVSRVELARQLDLAPSTVGIHIDRLADQGFVQEGAAKVRPAGRPPKVIELNPAAGQFIGIDLDARELYGVRIDFAQHVRSEQTTRLRANAAADEVVDQISAAIDALRDQSKPLCGIGIAVPGSVDNARGMALHYRFIRGWRNIEIVDRVGKHFDAPISIENNIRAMALAERSFGCTRSTQNSICVGVRTGIGSGVILGGELLRGTNDLAGEIGGWPVVASSGTATTLEEVASFRAVLTRAEQELKRGRKSVLELKRNRVDRKDFLAAANASDPLCRRILHDAAVSLGQSIAQMCLLINPEKVVLCGPLAALPENFGRLVREAVANFLPAFHSQAPSVETSTLGDQAGALGAAALAANAWTPREVE